MHDLSSYINLIIYILLWGIVCFKYYKRIKFSSGLIVILSYLLYSVLAFVLYIDESLGKSYKELHLFPFIYLFLMLYLFLTPVFKYEKMNITRMQRPSKRIILSFLVIYSVCTLIALPNTISKLQEGIVLLFVESSAGQDLYDLAKINSETSDSSISGIYGLFIIFRNMFIDISKFMFFYYLTFKHKSKLLLTLFSFSFIIDLLTPIASGGRTGVIMNAFSLIIALTLFYPFYEKRIRKVAKTVFIFTSILVAIPFMLLTISRFGERKDVDTSGSILSYISQAPLNFNEKVLDNQGTRNGDRTLNLFKQFIYKDVPKDIDGVRDKYSHHKIDDSLFSTFIGDFVLDFGPISTFFIIVFFSIIFYNNVRSFNKSIPFHTLLLIYFILCIAMQGGMYLFYYSFMQNMLIIAFIIMYIVLYIDSHTNKQHIYLYKK